MRKREFINNKDSVNLHINNRKRKFNETTYFSSPINQNEIDSIFNESENYPGTDKSKSFLKIKISTIIGKYI